MVSYGRGDRPKPALRITEDAEFTYTFGKTGLTPTGRSHKTTAHQYNDFLRKIDCKDVYRQQSDFEKSMNINAGEVCWSNYIDRMDTFLNKKFEEKIKKYEDEYDIQLKFKQRTDRRNPFDRDPAFTLYNLTVEALKNKRPNPRIETQPEPVSEPESESEEIPPEIMRYSPLLIAGIIVIAVILLLKRRRA